MSIRTTTPGRRRASWRQQRRVLRAAVAGGTLLAGVAGLGAQAGSADWPQFRGSPRLTGVAATTLPETPRVRWTYEADDLIESSAAIADGVVYVGVGSGDLIALDLETGDRRWTYATGELIAESSPAVADGVVYIGDLVGGVHAVRARDGTRLWRFAAEAEIRASPVIVDGLVLVGSYDTRLYALDAATGAVRWTVETDGPVHGTVAVQDGLAFIAGCDMIFRAIRIADGTEAYQIPAGAYTAASVVVSGDRAYFGTYEEEVLAFDLQARELLWRYSVQTRRFPYYSSGALLEGHLIVGGRDKHVHAIDVETGVATWTFATRARVDSSPVVADGRVYVGSSDGRLYVLDATTGRREWEFDAGDAITASPAVAAGRVVVGAHNGVIYCFG